MASGNSRRRHERSGLDSVRDDPVLGSSEARHTLNSNRVGPGAFDFCPHLVEHIRQVFHFRFTGCVFQHRLTLGQGSRHQQVFGSRHADRIEMEMRALQTLGARLHVSVDDLGFGSQLLKASQVEIDGPLADGATAGQGNLRPMHPGHQRPQNQDGGPHGPHELVRGPGALQFSGMDRQAIALAPVFERRIHPQLFQQHTQRRNIPNLGNVLQHDGFVGEQCRRDNRQGGVLGAADCDAAFQRPAPLDQKFFHGKDLFSSIGWRPLSRHRGRRPGRKRGSNPEQRSRGITPGPALYSTGRPRT